VDTQQFCGDQYSTGGAVFRPGGSRRDRQRRRPHQTNAGGGKVLRIIYRTIATHLINKVGYVNTTAQTGAAKLIFFE